MVSERPFRSTHLVPKEVLILVVVEDGLRVLAAEAEVNGQKVLILVVVEDGLRGVGRP